MPRSRHPFPGLPRCAALLLSLLTSTGTAQVSGAAIQNTATLHAGPLSTPSNTVTLTRRSACTPDLSPDGAADAPSRHLTFTAPGSLTVPYTLTQRGSAAGTVELTASLLTPADGVSVTVLDAASAPDRALLPLSSVTLAPGESRPVLLGVSASRAVSGTLLVNLAARCGDASDLQNVTALDAQSSLGLLLRHTVLPVQGTIGDAPTFTLSLPNPAAGPLDTEIRIQLPEGLAYQDGSATLSGGTGSVRLEGTVLIVTARVPAGQTLTVQYRLRILASAAASLDVPARASGTATMGGQSQVLASADATATLGVTAGVFDRRATLIGQVYLDSDGNGRFGPGDTALPGVRVLLSNGWQALTDDQGRYTFRNLNPGAWLVSLDRGQAPFEAEPGLGTRTVDTFALTRADFALIRPQATLTAPSRSGSVQAGPVEIARTVQALPGGGSQVTLTLTAASPVADVLVIETLPGDDTREFRFSLLSGTRTVSYLLPGPAAPINPQVSWRTP